MYEKKHSDIVYRAPYCLSYFPSVFTVSCVEARGGGGGTRGGPTTKRGEKDAYMLVSRRERRGRTINKLFKRLRRRHQSLRFRPARITAGRPGALTPTAPGNSTLLAVLPCRILPFVFRSPPAPVYGVLLNPTTI